MLVCRIMFSCLMPYTIFRQWLLPVMNLSGIYMLPFQAICSNKLFK
ncbi:hypothetical protein YPPY56_3327 [Yersinia pestis PY-56]|nr:hypothetical protein YPPY53_3328 [Yersinia pestis PY-53]EIS30292.1 hypothetical protein YPPY56_3327 [Yersinia pestis PY-56]EIT54411.1 hypothetical protein YPPY102_3275 [Yersinia pestis PY-102]